MAASSCAKVAHIRSGKTRLQNGALLFPAIERFLNTQQHASANGLTFLLHLTTLEDDDSLFAAMCAGARGYILKGAGKAAQLHISSKTVGNHISNIFNKLQVADRARAIVKAREAGLGRGSEQDDRLRHCKSYSDWRNC